MNHNPDHDSDNEGRYACTDCPSKCRQAHSLREHFENKHNRIVDMAYVNSLFQKERIVMKAPKGPKRIYNIITCTCGVQLKGTPGFKRHVKNIHESTAFDIFDKFQQLKKVPLENEASEQIQVSDIRDNQLKFDLHEEIAQVVTEYKDSSITNELLDGLPANCANESSAVNETESETRSEIMSVMNEIVCSD